MYGGNRLPKPEIGLAMRRRRSTSNWIVPGLVALATVAVLVIANAELGRGVAISLAVALLVYVATVLFVRRGKIH